MSEWTLILAAIIFAALIVVLYVWTSLMLVAFFRRAGEPTVKAWVPVLSLITVLKLRARVRAAVAATPTAPPTVVTVASGPVRIPDARQRPTTDAAFAPPVALVPASVPASLPASSLAPSDEDSWQRLTRQGWPSEEFDDVSAIVGAPTPAGSAPMSARAAVSDGWAALASDGAGFAEEAEGLRRSPDAVAGWALETPSGDHVTLTADVVFLGRRPELTRANGQAQRVSVSDDTMTMSKTHARLDRGGDGWVLTDLDSTNGTRLASQSADSKLSGQARLDDGEAFLLGDASFTLHRS